MQAESSTAPSDLQTLQRQIQDLTELYNKLQNLRQIPSALLTSISNDMPFIGQTRPEFQRLKEIGEDIRSSPIQEALLRAQDSLKNDGTEINSNPRRENRRRRRPPSPASPQPYISKAALEPRAFPPAAGNVQALSAEELIGYVKEYNLENKTKLQIWRRTADEPKTDLPSLLRFTIPDVVTVYISIGYHGGHGTILVENMAAFAPREKKAPHLQSEYTVYQNLSQQFARVLHSHPNISFQSAMSLLCSYELLFVDQCVGCGRVLSVEGHVPPVVRLWKDGEEGRWEPRHLTCRRDQ
ncbi:hypothetical protein P691DRAFT_663580 [Macrolepiota fuliginosa MF-IS2]|uniref:Mediator complex subunit 27 n=1 Tax=Macrolepiota fuliginosa MF-IS2 TaxID=1400762 RepID=A0A9P5XH08_9AGAR|nr:hypothetical protein P691DRAFT_663580 [Macrolepiota fuliginosa MF-IS2]